MRPTRAMVMAAGRGTRMRPLTDDRCKALVEVGGKPLIDWALDKLDAAGVGTAIVNVHHFADRLEAHLARREAGPDIAISDEREALMDTGGGLVKAAELLGADPVFVTNIDAFWVDGATAELDRLAGGFDAGAMDFRLLLSPLGENLGFPGAGDFHLEPDGRIARRGEGSGPLHAYAGVQVLHPRVLKGRTLEPFSTNRLWDEALQAGRIFGTPMDAFWMHVGDPEARDAAQNRLSSIRNDTAGPVRP